MELDRFNSDDTPAPTGDGQFDFRAGRTINLNRAEIIFPRLRPFDNGISRYFSEKGTPLPDTSEFYYPEIYDTTQTFAQQSLRNRYIVRGKASGEATSKYSLGFNVVEGSVQVLLDGSTLVQNVDYTVDYIIGEVVIKNERALVPGANLQIKYEQNDLFQLASKTLLGARGDLALSKTTNLGFTIMNLNQQTLSDRVRLGEEPNKNTIFGVDGSTSLDLPFLTRALDALPLIQTREPSSFKISGEAAYMLPDPNTKKSTIVSDNGEGIAYIDDFEGARRSIPIGISYNSWTQASPVGDSAHFFNVPDTTKMYSKGRMIWFNRLPTDVTIEEVYYNKYAPKGQNQVTVLDLQYFPLVRGQFNYSVDLENTLRPDRNWAGVMRPLSISAVNLTRENVNFVELWMRIDKVPGDRSGKTAHRSRSGQRGRHPEPDPQLRGPGHQLQSQRHASGRRGRRHRHVDGRAGTGPLRRDDRPVPGHGRGPERRQLRLQQRDRRHVPGGLHAHQRDGEQQGRAGRPDPRQRGPERQRRGGPEQLLLPVRAGAGRQPADQPEDRGRQSRVRMVPVPHSDQGIRADRGITHV